MAETYASRKAYVLKSLRAIRQRYRSADTAGEKLERELDRLLKRKTLVTPDSLSKMIELMDAYTTAVQQIQSPVADAVQVTSLYV